MEQDGGEIYRLDLPARLDIKHVLRLLPARSGRGRLDETARQLAEKAVAVARPKGIYRIGNACIIDRNTVAIDGIRFQSRILGKALRHQEKVFPFIVTIGSELDGMPPPRDMLRQLTLDAIKTVILVNAVDDLTQHIKDKYHLPHVALLNPGELEDFPLNQQPPLFALFGGREREIGVSLTTGNAIKPIKSRSGIIFPDESGFVSCKLCTQPSCPGRRAAYDPELAREYLG